MKENLFISRRFHFVIDAFNCDNKLLSDPDFLVNILKETATLLDMKILKGPEIAQGIPENPGYTVFAIIDFSHISIHTFTDPREFCLDIFSCKTFDFNALEKFIMQTFNLTEKNIFKSIVRYDQLNMERDKNAFSANQFISEYCADDNKEKIAILDWYKKTYNTLENKTSLLALEGTPSLYSATSASQKIDEITYGFCTKQCLEFVQNSTDEIKTKIKKISFFEPAIEQEEYTEKFEIVQSNLCLESHTDDISEYKRMLKYVNSYLKPQGQFLMVALEGAMAYKVGDKYFPAIYLDKEMAENYLSEAGFKIESMGKISCERPEITKYHGILLIKAIKN